MAASPPDWARRRPRVGARLGPRALS